MDVSTKRPQKPARLRELEAAIGDAEEARFAYALERGKTKGDVINQRAATPRRRTRPTRKRTA